LRRMSVYCTGRRKEAVARVRLVPGTGRKTVNGMDAAAYFSREAYLKELDRPLAVADALEKFDVEANVRGGGLSGQVGAVCLGISRCLANLDPELKAKLGKNGLLRRDPRMKERKKPGMPGARKRFQFSKR